MSSFALWNVSHAFLSSSPLSSSFSIANVRYDMKHPSTNSLMFGMLFLTCGMIIMKAKGGRVWTRSKSEDLLPSEENRKI